MRLSCRYKTENALKGSLQMHTGGWRMTASRRLGKTALKRSSFFFLCFYFKIGKTWSGKLRLYFETLRLFGPPELVRGSRLQSCFVSLCWFSSILYCSPLQSHPCQAGKPEFDAKQKELQAVMNTDPWLGCGFRFFPHFPTSRSICNVLYCPSTISTYICPTSLVCQLKCLAWTMRRTSGLTRPD